MTAALRRVVRGVVFDMDGTLTVPVFDFALMRKRVGVDSGDILDVIKSWPDAEQKRAFDVIAEMEEEALLKVEVMPGVVDLCKHLDLNGLPRGLITRNVMRGVDYFHKHAWPLTPFIPAISRECSFAYKPSPESLLHICSEWGISPTQCIMVGDSAKDDIVCGNRAGAATILLTTGNTRYTAALEGEQQPTFQVASLTEVTALLQQHFTLLPPGAPEPVQ